MKPRFSILTILGLTAYVAINVAALQTRSSGWPEVLFFAWLTILVAASIHAAQPASGAVVFARAFVLTSLVYVAATCAYRMVTFGDPPLPHIYLTRLTNTWLSGPNRGPMFDPFVASPALGLFFVPFLNVSIAFGLLGGSLALWRYRRQQGREKEQVE